MTLRESPGVWEFWFSESAMQACYHKQGQMTYSRMCLCVAVVLHLVTRFSMTLLIRLSATDRLHTHTRTHTAWLRGYHIVKTGNTLGAVATYREQWDRHAAHHHRQQQLHLLRSCCVFSQVSRHNFFFFFLFLTLFNSLHFSLFLHLQSLCLSLTV